MEFVKNENKLSLDRKEKEVKAKNDVKVDV